MEITTMTAPEIDKILNNLWCEEMRIASRLQDYKGNLKRYQDRIEEDPRVELRYRNSIHHFEEEIPKLEEAFKVNRSEAHPYEAEYRSRPWNRYYLVRQANGHVHRGMDCSSCYPTTEYGWLTDLSGCDEGEMVEEYGEMACTVCFPDAPVHPAFIRSTEEREAAEKAKADSTCRGGRNYYGPARYARCKECGAGVVSVTPNGALRSHRKS